MKEQVINNRDTLYLMVIALAMGVIIGLLLAPKGRRQRTTDSHNTVTRNFIRDRKRANLNFVVGNIVIGSNNGRENLMPLGIEDNGETR